VLEAAAGLIPVVVHSAASAVAGRVPKPCDARELVAAVAAALPPR
jgi:hypothetical protein